MAELSSITPLSLQPTALTAFTLDVSAGSGGDKYVGTSTGKMLLLARNNSTDTARTVTITGVADKFGLVSTVAADSLAFGAFHLYALEGAGWLDDAGKLNVAGSTTDIEYKLFNVVK